MNSLFPKQEWTDFAPEGNPEANKFEDFSAADAPVSFWTARQQRRSTCWQPWRNANRTLTQTARTESEPLEGLSPPGCPQIRRVEPRLHQVCRNKTIKAKVEAATTESLKIPFQPPGRRDHLEALGRPDGVVATNRSPWLERALLERLAQRSEGGEAHAERDPRGSHGQGLQPRGKHQEEQQKATKEIQSRATKGSKALALSFGSKGKGSAGTGGSHGGSHLPGAQRGGARLPERARTPGSGYPIGFSGGLFDQLEDSRARRLLSIADKKLISYKCAHGSGGKNGSRDGKTRGSRM
ncbi:MAG: hypothetical protein R3F11_21945 [Verrucomicrobiales bacterium]